MAKKDEPVEFVFDVDFEDERVLNALARLLIALTPEAKEIHA